MILASACLRSAAERAGRSVVRARAKIGLQNLAYNIRRLVTPVPTEAVGGKSKRGRQSKTELNPNLCQSGVKIEHCSRCPIAAFRLAGGIRNRTCRLPPSHPRGIAPAR